MKKVILLLCVSLSTFLSSYANRGDIISYEEFRNWDSTAAIDNYWNIISSHIPEPMQDSFRLVFSDIMRTLMQGKRIVSYRVIYKTIDHYGNPTQASGLVIFPVHDGKICNLPIFYYGHGTIFERYSAPSRPDRWGTESFFVYMAAALNFIGVAPDYYGLGDGPGFHHHNSAQTNASSGIDMIRAARNLAAIKNIGYNSQVYISGYSEGGHNAMGILKMVNDQNLRSEFNIISAGCGSGAYDESDISYHFILDNPYYPTRQYILYIVATCEDIYGNLIHEELGETVSTYLKPPYDSLYNIHLLGQDGQLDWVPLPWTDMLKPGVLESVTSNPNHPLRQCLKQSDLYDWANPFRTNLYYVKTDQQVNWKNAPKAKLAQWKYIPWYRFWDKARIITHDMTNHGSVPSHEEGAIPIMLHYMIFSNGSKIMDCSDSTGRLSSRTTQSAFRLNYDKSLEIPVSAVPGLQKAELINFSDFRFENVNIGEEKKAGVYRLNMPGIDPAAYVLRLTDITGKSVYRGLLYDEPEFLESDDYNPVSLSNGNYLLDLTLLNDPVKRVVLYTQSGKTLSTIDDPYAVQQLAEEKNLEPGTYVVEIQAKEMNYYLKFEAGKNIISAAQLSPNPFTNQIIIKDIEAISNIRVFNMEGKEFVLSQKTGDKQVEINTASLPAGLYLFQLTGSSGSKTVKAIKF